jgi:hypothetical protein
VGHREFAAFTACATLIALNIVVESLVALRPGARLRDHVVEAVVPLVVLAAVWLLYRRLRPGVRGAMQLFFGVLTLLWAGMAVADASRAGFRVHHVTGFLLIPAGAGLLWLAAALLLKSRKPGRLRYLRRAGWVIVALLAAYWVVVPIGMAAYATHRPQTAVPRPPAGVVYEDVTLRTADGVQLQAWYIPSRNGAAVVTYPREWTTAHAKMLAEQGYGVLLLDMRGYGESQGDPNALGWGRAGDIDAGVAYLQTRPDVDDGRVGGLGLSVGGEQMIEAAAANPALQAVVAEGAGERSVKESVIRGPRGYFAVPMMAVETAATAVFSGQAVPPALDDLAGDIAPRALLLIYAENGGGGEELTPDYFAATGEPKSLWMIPGGKHTAGITEHPQEYATRVGQFFAQTLLR